MMTAIERQTMRKVYLRLLPFCFILYFICYLDRVNIGFAALTMNKDLGLSSYMFGLGAGAFFWGYFILEVPSNLILDRVGARRWIARIMVSWGLVSGAFAFINGPVSFFILRFLLGLAEAGFFPGMILYFTYWFPPSHRSRIVAGFMAAIPVSIGLGAPLSTAFLELDGVLGVAGWRWLFICEAAPAVIFGIATFFYLTDRPAQADWLEAEEQEWLAKEMEKERNTVETGRTISVLQSLFNPRVLALAAIHFGQAGVSVGIAVFAAQIIKRLGLTNMQTGFTTAIPYVLGTIGMIVWGSYSDRKNERRWNLTASCTTMAVGCLIRHDGQQLLGRGGAVAGDDWPIRLECPFVSIAGGVSDGASFGERHRLGQFGRHLGRQRQPTDRRLVQGFHRKLQRRTLRPCHLCSVRSRRRRDQRARDAGSSAAASTRSSWRLAQIREAR